MYTSPCKAEPILTEPILHTGAISTSIYLFSPSHSPREPERAQAKVGESCDGDEDREGREHADEHGYACLGQGVVTRALIGVSLARGRGNNLYNECI